MPSARLLSCTVILMTILEVTMAQVDSCSLGQDVTLTGGTNYRRRSSCLNPSPCTTALCQAYQGQCSFTRNPQNASCPLCRRGCIPNCTARACGDDGCNGVCGVCSKGHGCLDGTCTSTVSSGSCQAPHKVKFSPGLTIVNGSTAQQPHILTPACNYRSFSPEEIWTFEVPAGKRYGYDIRVTGYDTVLQLMNGTCNSTAQIACNDDATPPGDLQSMVSGWVHGGTYFVMVDGYSVADKGPYELSLRFIEGCRPSCDGNFCGEDGCGQKCGSCASTEKCFNNRCYPNPCEPKCFRQNSKYNRTCGEDGCGGSCGTCQADEGCVGPSIKPDAEDTAAGISVPVSFCEKLKVCSHFNPTCTPACSAKQFCASDCQCYDKDARLPDLQPSSTELANDIYYQTAVFPNASCVFMEKCVSGPGPRKLLRFTSTNINQGGADLVAAHPKTDPTNFEWGSCHGHYHFKDFQKYELMSLDGRTTTTGQKAAFCLEDTRRELEGDAYPCDRKYDCGKQGIQVGWVDSYGWSLDCSWLDVTDVPLGQYVLQVEANPVRRIAEENYDNNKVCVKVNITNNFPDIALHTPGVIVDCPLRICPDNYYQGFDTTEMLGGSVTRVDANITQSTYVGGIGSLVVASQAQVRFVASNPGRITFYAKGSNRASIPDVAFSSMSVDIACFRIRPYASGRWYVTSDDNHFPLTASFSALPADAWLFFDIRSDYETFLDVYIENTKQISVNMSNPVNFKQSCGTISKITFFGGGSNNYAYYDELQLLCNNFFVTNGSLLEASTTLESIQQGGLTLTVTLVGDTAEPWNTRDPTSLTQAFLSSTPQPGGWTQVGSSILANPVIVKRQLRFTLTPQPKYRPGGDDVIRANFMLPSAFSASLKKRPAGPVGFTIFGSCPRSLMETFMEAGSITPWGTAVSYDSTYKALLLRSSFGASKSWIGSPKYERVSFSFMCGMNMSTPGEVLVRLHFMGSFVPIVSPCNSTLNVWRRVVISLNWTGMTYSAQCVGGIRSASINTTGMIPASMQYGLTRLVFFSNATPTTPAYITNVTADCPRRLPFVTITPTQAPPSQWFTFSFFPGSFDLKESDVVHVVRESCSEKYYTLTLAPSTPFHWRGTFPLDMAVGPYRVCYNSELIPDASFTIEPEPTALNFRQLLPSLRITWDVYNTVTGEIDFTVAGEKTAQGVEQWYAVGFNVAPSMIGTDLMLFSPIGVTALVNKNYSTPVAKYPSSGLSNISTRDDGAWRTWMVRREGIRRNMSWTVFARGDWMDGRPSKCHPMDRGARRLPITRGTCPGARPASWVVEEGPACLRWQNMSRPSQVANYLDQRSCVCRNGTLSSDAKGLMVCSVSADTCESLQCIRRRHNSEVALYASAAWIGQSLSDECAALKRAIVEMQQHQENHCLGVVCADSNLTTKCSSRAIEDACGNSQALYDIESYSHAVVRTRLFSDIIDLGTFQQMKNRIGFLINIHPDDVIAVLMFGGYLRIWSPVPKPLNASLPMTLQSADIVNALLNDTIFMHLYGVRGPPKTPSVESQTGLCDNHTSSGGVIEDPTCPNLNTSSKYCHHVLCRCLGATAETGSSGEEVCARPEIPSGSPGSLACRATWKVCRYQYLQQFYRQAGCQTMLLNATTVPKEKTKCIQSFCTYQNLTEFDIFTMCTTFENDLKVVAGLTPHIQFKVRPLDPMWNITRQLSFKGSVATRIPSHAGSETDIVVFVLVRGTVCVVFKKVASSETLQAFALKLWTDVTFVNNYRLIGVATYPDKSWERNAKRTLSETVSMSVTEAMIRFPPTPTPRPPPSPQSPSPSPPRNPPPSPPSFNLTGALLLVLRANPEDLTPLIRSQILSDVALHLRVKSTQITAIFLQGSTYIYFRVFSDKLMDLTDNYRTDLSALQRNITFLQFYGVLSINGYPSPPSTSESPPESNPFHGGYILLVVSLGFSVIVGVVLALHWCQRKPEKLLPPMNSFNPLDVADQQRARIRNSAASPF